MAKQNKKKTSLTKARVAGVTCCAIVVFVFCNCGGNHAPLSETASDAPKAKSLNIAQMTTAKFNEEYCPFDEQHVTDCNKDTNCNDLKHSVGISTGDWRNRDPITWRIPDEYIPTVCTIHTPGAGHTTSYVCRKIAHLVWKWVEDGLISKECCNPKLKDCTTAPKHPKRSGIHSWEHPQTEGEKRVEDYYVQRKHKREKEIEKNKLSTSQNGYDPRADD